MCPVSLPSNRDIYKTAAKKTSAPLLQMNVCFSASHPVLSLSLQLLSSSVEAVEGTNGELHEKVRARTQQSWAEVFEGRSRSAPGQVKLEAFFYNK